MFRKRMNFLFWLNVSFALPILFLIRYFKNSFTLDTTLSLTQTGSGPL